MTACGQKKHLKLVFVVDLCHLAQVKFFEMIFQQIKLETNVLSRFRVIFKGKRISTIILRIHRHLQEKKLSSRSNL